MNFPSQQQLIKQPRLDASIGQPWCPSLKGASERDLGTVPTPVTLCLYWIRCRALPDTSTISTTTAAATTTTTTTTTTILHVLLQVTTNSNNCLFAPMLSTPVLCRTVVYCMCSISTATMLQKLRNSPTHPHLPLPYGGFAVFTGRTRSAVDLCVDYSIVLTRVFK